MSAPTKTHLIIGAIIFIFLCSIAVLGLFIMLSGNSKSQEKTSGTPPENNVYYVFFSQEGVSDCQSVVGIVRDFDQKPSYQDILEELLKGPRFSETQAGYRSNLPAGVSIQSIQVVDGLMLLDFSTTFLDVAGSCRVQAIESQINKTMTQFEEIDNVSISVNGQTEAVLQP